MAITNIPVDKAELLSVILEGLLYGTIWVLLSRRSTHQINHAMFTVACLLLLCSTVHLVISIIRIMEGLILFRNTFPGGPAGYFLDVSQWTFVSKNYVYTAQTLIGDGVVLYRCYMVWKSKLITILPTLLWCAVLVTGIVTPYTELRATQNEVFDGSLSRWITSFWASTLVTNLLATLLLAYRVWSVDRKSGMSLGPHASKLRPVLRVVIDAGMIYSFTLFAALICFVNRSNGQYVILGMITPIIAITFYMVIIRAGLAIRVSQMSHPRRPDNAITLNSTNLGEGGYRMQVQVTSLVGNDLDCEQSLHLPVSARTPRDSGRRQSEIEFDGIVEV